MQWLVEQSLNPEEGDEDGVTPIHVAHDVNVLRYFLEPEPLGLNCNPNIRSGRGQTPLHFAARYNKIDIVRYLVCERKCDYMQCDNDGHACSHYAAEQNNSVLLLELLLQSGCALSQKTRKVGHLSTTPSKQMLPPV